MLYEEEIYILILRSLHITGRCNRQSVSTSFESVPHCKDRQRLLISRILVSVNTDVYIYIYNILNTIKATIYNKSQI